MSNPDHIPPPQMAERLGVGRLARHVLLCLGPDCCHPDAGKATWNYLKRRLKELGLSDPDCRADRIVFRTKCDCLRICTSGPICVVYPEGAWYHNADVTNVERIVQNHLIGGRVVEELCFARNPLPLSGGDE